MEYLYTRGYPGTGYPGTGSSLFVFVCTCSLCTLLVTSTVNTCMHVYCRTRVNVYTLGVVLVLVLPVQLQAACEGRDEAIASGGVIFGRRIRIGDLL